MGVKTTQRTYLTSGSDEVVLSATDIVGEALAKGLREEFNAHLLRDADDLATMDEQSFTEKELTRAQRYRSENTYVMTGLRRNPTNAEIVRYLRDHPDKAERFDELLAEKERVWRAQMEAARVNFEGNYYDYDEDD